MLSDLPRCILGASGINIESSEAIDDSLAFLDRWYASGGRAIDTARVYAAGAKEELIGTWLQSRGFDDCWVISKGCHHDVQGPRCRPQDFHHDLAASLDALRRDHLELYLYHRDDETIPARELLDVAQPYLNDGTIGAIGVSNWSHRRIAEANDWAKQEGKVPFSANSPQFSVVAPEHMAWEGCVSISGDAEAVQWHQDQANVHILAWQPLAAGFLTNRDMSAEHPRYELYQQFDTAENRQIREDLSQQALAEGSTVAEQALRYILHFQRSHVIIGTSRIENWQTAMKTTIQS